VIRVELLVRYPQFFSQGNLQNEMLTLHGTVMIFLWIVLMVNGAFG